VTDAESVVMVFNNDSRPVEMEFDVWRVLTSGAVLVDRLGQNSEVRVTNGKLSLNLPAREAAMFVPK
jgi:hypothetical protein